MYDDLTENICHAKNYKQSKVNTKWRNTKKSLLNLKFWLKFVFNWDINHVINFQ